MNRTLTLGLLILLALIGVADSWYLFQSAVNHTALACDIGAGLDGCNIVAQSAYSRLFGLPLALYGVGFFGLMLAAGMGLLSYPSRLLYQALLAVAVAGALMSVAFVFIQVALIQAFCIYCMLSAGLSFAALGLSWSLWKRFGAVRVP